MIALREMTAEGFARVVDWQAGTTRDGLYQWAGDGYVYPLTLNQFQRRLEGKEINDEEATAFVYGIYLSDELIGTAELMVTDALAGTGSFGKFFIEPSHRGKGYASQVITAVSQIAFGMKGLNMLFLKVFDFNSRAFKCYKKSGFDVVKYEKNAYRGANGPWHRYYMVLRKEVWLKQLIAKSKKNCKTVKP